MTAAARRRRFMRRTGWDLTGLDHRQARRLMRRVADRQRPRLLELARQHDLIVLYGYCPVCRAPRDVERINTRGPAGLEVLLRLVCTRDYRHGR